MLAWLRRLFSAPPSSPPPWALDLADALQKGARAQARLGARLDTVDSKLEGGFADLRSLLEATEGGDADELPWPELFDAADALDAAAAHLGVRGEGELAEGITVARRRLETFMTSAGYERLTAPEHRADARLYRAVAPSEGQAAAQVLRAAVRLGAEVVREGEVTGGRHDDVRD